MYFWIHTGVILEQRANSDEKGTVDEYGDYHAPDVSYSIVDDLEQEDTGDSKA
jgi:hypothetical protein